MTEPLLEGKKFPVVIALPVLWGDQDAFGHVNNVVPIRWFESARVAYLEQSELASLMTPGGVGPILAAVQCSYRRQINYPDTVHVTAQVSRLGRSSMTIEHRVYSQSGRVLAAEGVSTVVMFDYQSQRPVRISETMRAAIEKLEGKSYTLEKP